MYHIFVFILVRFFKLGMFSYGSRLYQLRISPFHSELSRNVIELRHLPFFISMHVHDQPENVKRHSFDENNVNKHTTFCDIRKLFKDRTKSTKCKVMFLTSNKIEYR